MRKVIELVDVIIGEGILVFALIVAPCMAAVQDGHPWWWGIILFGTAIIGVAFIVGAVGIITDGTRW